METVAAGELTYAGRDKAAMPGAVESLFVGPQAALTDRACKQIGMQYGPPAIWHSDHRSRVSGTQVAGAPSGAGNISYQLVKASETVSSGAKEDVTCLQRVASTGGAASSGAPADKGAKIVVPDQGEYSFWETLLQFQANIVALATVLRFSGTYTLYCCAT